MANPPYDQGEVATITVVVTDPDTGARIDPANVYLVLLKPDGTTYIRYNYVSNPTNITRLSLGVYRAKIPVDQGGVWTGRWYNPSGAGQLSTRFAFVVVGDLLV